MPTFKKTVDMMSPSLFERVRGVRFTAKEVDILVREVLSRQKTIYGDRDSPRQKDGVRRAWEEVAAAVNSAKCGPVRTAIQCRKRFNDVRRLGKRTMKWRAHSDTETSESVSQTGTQDQDPAACAPPAVNGQQAATPEDTAAASQSAPTEEKKTDSEGQTDPAPPAAALPLRRKRGRPRKQQLEREILDIQRSQFDLLHRELVGFRRSISRMESRMVPLLRSISKSLERMADAFDYITAPATDGLSNSGLLNNSNI